MFAANRLYQKYVSFMYYLVSKTLFFSFTLIREEDKNIFDYCRENNIDHITKVIKSKNVDVNMKDEEVRKMCPVKYFLMFYCSASVLFFLNGRPMNYNSNYSMVKSMSEYLGGGVFSSVVECVPSVHEVPSSIPSTLK